MRGAAACLSIVVGISQPLACQEVALHVSSAAGDRIAPRGPLHFEPRRAEGERDASFVIDGSVTHQKIDGFGASFLEAGLICINALPPDEQEAVLRALFDPNLGAGFSAMKTVIAGTDFMSAGPWYSYDETPGDVDLKDFSIQRDLGPNGLVTFIKRARRHGSFELQAPMDYPPDWMLIDLEKKQDVDPRYYGALARYYLRYLREYEKQGIVIDYLSLFNEPGVYTKISYPEIRDLLRDHVGPLLEKEGVKTRLQLSEAPVRDFALRDYPVVLDDPAARRYVAVVPYHGYDLTKFDRIAELHRRYPDLPLWMTEICHAYQAGTRKEMPLPRLDFEDGDFWGNQIFSDLEASASAWIYWNLVLDQDGGPCLVSPIHGNPPSNVQHPVVVIDRAGKKVIYTGLYYYLAHFAKFVRPGSTRIDARAKSKSDLVRGLAFRGPDGDWIVQLMNRRKEESRVQLEWQGRFLEAALPGMSITTCRWK